MASDGLLARDSGEWAKEKLFYVSRYMAIFNGGMKNKWASRPFVDLMTGCGRNIVPRTGEEFDGSPVLALQCATPFSQVVLVEEDAALVDALGQRLQAFDCSATSVIPGDCNDASVIERIRASVPASGLALVFVDMLGLNVTFDTLMRLTRGRSMDMMITFQVNDLTRNVPLVLGGRSSRARLDAFFGSSGWEEVARRERRGRDLAADLTDYYCARLATIGYDHVAQLHVLMKNTRNAPLYRLILAGKDKKAKEFFEKISRIEYSGQRGLTF